ncbi:protein phosphatase 1 regulatory subunit 3D-like isoform X1 [Paramormyrops kingsleyae]|uniref:Protein phosphatase 1 regulatory subunit 3G n=1 Tax=Paramormyrops kingsleyae TaxID=1676925 RepID=A0A3B3RWU2_9TELE|nr:protein phosphatase 1 regulatory subunit 3D-like isoform X1 [Paramormyrops kingsleyae]
MQECRNLERSKLKGAGDMLPKLDAQLEEVFSHLVLEQEDEDKNDKRRTKSLPLSPEGCKKRVQFADAFGLNLAIVKHFSLTEEYLGPSHPAQHERASLDDLCHTLNSELGSERFVPYFKMPVETERFDALLQRCRVALEKVTVYNFDIRGSIRALTSDCCRKEVGVRYTFTDWRSFLDVQATLAAGHGDAETGERYGFTVHAPPLLDVGSSVHFAVYCRTDQADFWDNNEGRNYSLVHQRKVNRGDTESSAV